MAKEKITAPQVMELLKTRYPLPGFALLENVADSTGYGHQRWADAVVMSVWPSRGYYFMGFEIKVSRQDWLSELRKPEKADPVMKHCQEWYLVTGDEMVCREGELPATWGHLTVKAGKLHCKVKAPTINKVDGFYPKHIDVDFVASVLRNALTLAPKQLARERQRVFDEARKEAKDGANYELTRLKKIVAEFEQKSGITMNTYDGGTIGAAVKMVQSLKYDVKTLQRAHKEVKEIATGLEQLMAMPALSSVVESITKDEQEYEQVVTAREKKSKRRTP